MRFRLEIARSGAQREQQASHHESGIFRVWRICAQRVYCAGTQRASSKTTQQVGKYYASHRRVKESAACALNECVCQRCVCVPVRTARCDREWPRTPRTLLSSHSTLRTGRVQHRASSGQRDVGQHGLHPARRLRACFPPLRKHTLSAISRRHRYNSTYSQCHTQECMD